MAGFQPVLGAALTLMLAHTVAAATPTASVSFNVTFQDYMVLQRAPQRAAVFGTLAGASRTSCSQDRVVVAVKDNYSGKSYLVSANITHGTQWKALLPPTEQGGDHTISVTATLCSTGHDKPVTTSASISHVTFGDVWFCSGQSNMWLPLHYTFSRNETVQRIQNGHYSNIRAWVGDSQKPPTTWTWMTPQQALVGGNTSAPEYPLFSFSATCFYFAVRLTDMWNTSSAVKGQPVPVIGLMCNAIGGSMIEEWTSNKTSATCHNISVQAHNQMLFDQLIIPFISVTVKGFLWYQGENNCRYIMGNYADGVGYGCQLPAMVSEWRSLWSATPGTTDALAPFGIVTLAAGGSEGGPDIGGMRWSQTANYGVVPNAALPNTFLAQGYDIGDPWPSKQCYYWGCCSPGSANKSHCETGECAKYCAVLAATNVYMGPIHPRDKIFVGQRLAQAALVAVYSDDMSRQPFTGPTLAGCTVHSSAGVNEWMEVRFNTSLLRGDALLVQPYNRSLNASGLHVLVDPKLWCLQTQRVGNQWVCLDQGHVEGWPKRTSTTPFVLASPTGGSGGNPYETDLAWIPVDISSMTESSLNVDLSHLNGAKPYAIRYAWGDVQDTCCPNNRNVGITEPCPPASCPVKASPSMLPANPFVARIVDGRCRCLVPQSCNG